jgi:hypothetical protein
VDKDGRIIGLLKTELLAAGIDNVEIREADILRVDLDAIAREAGRPLVVLGNLPYNISSQVIVQLIHARSRIDRAVLMLQKEMAQRICAGPDPRTMAGCPSCWGIVRTHGADAGAGAPVFSGPQGGFHRGGHPVFRSTGFSGP